MKIILEGPDGAGKSTLAKQLAEQTGYPIAHRSKPANEEEKRKMMESYLEGVQNGNNEIWDRCWYSEMVYGPVMRDQSYIQYNQMLALERELVVNGGALIIHCTDDTLSLWNRANNRGEDYIADVETLDALRKGYEDLFKGQHLITVVRYELSKKMS